MDVFFSTGSLKLRVEKGTHETTDFWSYAG